MAILSMHRSALSRIRPAITTTARSYATRRLPNFNYQSGHGQVPPPTVEYTNDPEEADELISSLRSKRLTIGLESLTKQIKTRDGEWTSMEGDLSAITLTDKEGVIVLHLAAMNYPPSLLKVVLENPGIQKQSFGAQAHQLRFLKQYKEYRTIPNNFLDLRNLTEKLFSELLTRKHDHLPHNNFKAYALEVLFELSISGRTSGQFDWTVERLGLGSPALESTVNQSWAAHLLGIVIHGALERHHAQLLETMGPLLGGLEYKKLMYDSTWTQKDIELMLEQEKVKQIS